MLAHLQQLFDNTSLGSFLIIRICWYYRHFKKVFKIQMDILILAAVELLSESSNMIKCQLHWTVLSQDLNSSVTSMNFQEGMNKWIIHTRSFIYYLSEMNWEACFSPRTYELWTYAGVQALHRRSHENLCQLLPVQCLQLGQLVSHLFCHLRRNIDWRRPKFLGSCIPPISCSISQLCFLFFNIMWGAAPSAWRWLLCAMWHDYLFFLVLLKKKGKWAQRAVAVWRQREMGRVMTKHMSLFNITSALHPWAMLGWTTEDFPGVSTYVLITKGQNFLQTGVGNLAMQRRYADLRLGNTE